MELHVVKLSNFTLDVPIESEYADFTDEDGNVSYNIYLPYPNKPILFMIDNLPAQTNILEYAQWLFDNTSGSTSKEFNEPVSTFKFNNENITAYEYRIMTQKEPLQLIHTIVLDDGVNKKEIIHLGIIDSFLDRDRLFLEVIKTYQPIND